MSTTPTFALLGNATSLPWAEVPEWPIAAFVDDTAAELERGARLCAWFGVPEGASANLRSPAVLLGLGTRPEGSLVALVLAALALLVITRGTGPQHAAPIKR